MTSKRTSRGKQKLDMKKHVAEAKHENLKTLASFGYWSIKEDAESYQYDQVEKVDTALVNLTNKIISHILVNGGEINHQGMCIYSRFHLLMMSNDFILCF